MTQRRVRKAIENDRDRRSGKRHAVKKVWVVVQMHISLLEQRQKRPILTIAGHSSFSSSPSDDQIVKIISQIIRACYPGPHESYKDYPKDNKVVVMEFLTCSSPASRRVNGKNTADSSSDENSTLLQILIESHFCLIHCA